MPPHRCQTAAGSELRICYSFVFVLVILFRSQALGVSKAQWKLEKVPQRQHGTAHGDDASQQVCGKAVGYPLRKNEIITREEIRDTRPQSCLQLFRLHQNLIEESHRVLHISLLAPPLSSPQGNIKTKKSPRQCGCNVIQDKEARAILK